ncbi:MAG TPA: spermidine synthase [Nitrospirota bacterium]|nr:spermidine synthase [Nitrospirota bacterium]
MAKPWHTIDKADTPDGVLELRQRGEGDFLILINGRVLMNSSASRSELALGRVAGLAAGMPRPRVLIGGLGMGLTLRAALDVLPPASRVVVAELNPIILRWCQGPLSGLTKNAVHDTRVMILLEDVSRVITQAAQPHAEKFGAILIDLYEGPHAKTDPVNDRFYGSGALEATADALSTGGVFAVWCEQGDAAFERRLQSAGFSVDRERPGRGGLRHAVYIGRISRTARPHPAGDLIRS